MCYVVLETSPSYLTVCAVCPSERLLKEREDIQENVLSHSRATLYLTFEVNDMFIIWFFALVLGPVIVYNWPIKARVMSATNTSHIINRCNGLLRNFDMSN